MPYNFSLPTIIPLGRLQIKRHQFDSSCPKFSFPHFNTERKPFSWLEMAQSQEKPGITEIQVRVDCNGCVQKIKKALRGINGISDVYIDLPRQKLTIVGWADPERIIKAVKKARKNATIYSHSEAREPPLTQPPDPAPPETEAPPPANDGNTPEKEPQPPEPPKDQPPPSEPPQENHEPPPENPTTRDPPPNEAQHHQHSEVEEVHVIHHHPPDYRNRLGYDHNRAYYSQGYGPDYNPRPSYSQGYGPSFSSGPSYNPEPPPDHSQGYERNYNPNPRPNYGPSFGSEPSYNPEPPPNHSQGYERNYNPNPNPNPRPGYSQGYGPSYGSEPSYNPRPVQVMHSYNQYRPAPYVTQYGYVQSPPRNTPYAGMENYNYYYNNGDYQSSENSNGYMASMLSEENPNACTIS